MNTFTEAAAYTLKFINQTRRSVFLTGKAGTGKTTLLKEIIRSTHKNTVVVAPTGIAALNAGGVTIHSMFQLPFAGFLPVQDVAAQFSGTVKFETKDSLRRHFRMNGQKKAVLTQMELLVIDEVSMLRADLLDAIDFMLQTVRKNRQPFGGVQVLFIGDLLQLPPVVKDEEWRQLRQYYKGKFFFHSHVVQQNPPLYIELSKIFRQSDSQFIELLNNLRNNLVTAQDVQLLNAYVQPDFDLKNHKGYITLTTHNAKADTINIQSLKDLKGNSRLYFPETVGDFPEKIFPVEAQLELKVGAQVMFIKNDLSAEKRFFNGKMGFVSALSEQEILVHFPDENKTIEVEKYEWQNIRYQVDPLTKEISEEVLGTFVQYPIRLAWAITVHKSQGLTFDKAALDVSQVFLPGQAYVALSRLRSLNGLILLSPLRMNGISNDQEVMDYALNKAEETLLEAMLQAETRQFLLHFLKESFNWTELAQEWRNHQFSYQDAEKSAKTGHGNWAKSQSEAMGAMVLPAQKFGAQLQQLFSAEEVDLAFICDRINAASDYFMPALDNLVTEILYKLEEVRRMKKAKAFFEELMLLEELQTRAVQRLMKAKLLMRLVVSGQEISKENLADDAIKFYKRNKLDTVRAQFESVNVTLIEDDADLQRYVSKKKTPKEPKKSTVQETYELWLQHNSVKEIANLRKLTVQTIHNHFAKLIQSETIQLSDVLPPEKIDALSAAFKGYKEESLNGLKEKYGDQFTWDELKMYKASLG